MKRWYVLVSGNQNQHISHDYAFFPKSGSRVVGFPKIGLASIHLPCDFLRAVRQPQELLSIVTSRDTCTFLWPATWDMSYHARFVRENRFHTLHYLRLVRK